MLSYSCNVGCGRDVPLPYDWGARYFIHLTDSNSQISQVRTAYKDNMYITNYGGRNTVDWKIAVDKPGIKVVITHTNGTDSFYYDALLTKNFRYDGCGDSKVMFEFAGGNPQVTTSSFSKVYYTYYRFNEAAVLEVTLNLKK